MTQALFATNTVERICTAIAGHGLCVVPDFLPAHDVAALAADARRRDDAGLLRAARVGRGAQRIESPETRGDRTAWLYDDDPAPALHSVRAALENLRRALNASLFLGLASVEAHYALYPPGAFYRRHRDRFRNDDARVISCVLYLNDNWKSDDGGELRIYLPDGTLRDLVPSGGALVVFVSERFEHEVLPARRERLALTGWFCRRTL